MATVGKLGRSLWQTLSSIKTGVILLILVVIFAAAGTLVLQRPITEPEEIQRAYSPEVLRIFDAVGLTDVFHAWWFVLLLVLVSLCIVSASIDRFPNAWRYFARPYKRPDEAFRKALPTQQQIVIPNEDVALPAAERACHELGYYPERVISQGHTSLFAERNRFSELAVYIVHTSLLLIFLGGIIDALYGWRGYVSLTPGQQISEVALRDGSVRSLPFAIRCDGAGQENYADGTPKRWWSKLAVLKDGRDVQGKEIVVNDPLVYGGVRFYQSSYGPTGKMEKLILTARPRDGGAAREVALGANETVPLDDVRRVRLAEFIPDYVVRDGQVYTRSNNVDNPAVHLVVESKTGDSAVNVWLPPIPGFEQNDRSPFRFEAQDLKMEHFTGLQVSHEPGQWAVWGGVILMGIGLAFVFYLVHERIWVVPARDARGGWWLWIGGTSNKNRDVFAEHFQRLAARIESEIQAEQKLGITERSASLAGD
jgi:cytochrome c biogenesis protein